MNPDDTLRGIRNILASERTRELAEWEVRELCQEIHRLDIWLTCGAMPPVDWACIHERSEATDYHAGLSGAGTREEGPDDDR